MGDKQATESIRVAKAGTCRSISRRSELGYDIGIGPEGEVYFRVTSNSAPGAFARTWVSWNSIRKAIEVPARTKSITSAHLAGLGGRGQNTAGFLIGILAEEELLKPSSTKKRAYELVDDTAFLESVRTWNQWGKGAGTSTGAKARTETGAKPAKTTKGDLAASPEGKPADARKSIPSFVAKDSPSTKPKRRTPTAAKKGSTKAAKDATRKSTTKRR